MGITFVNKRSVEEIMDDVKEELEGRIVDMDIDHYINSENEDMFLAKVQFK